MGARYLRERLGMCELCTVGEVPRTMREVDAGERRRG